MRGWTTASNLLRDGMRVSIGKQVQVISPGKRQGVKIGARGGICSLHGRLLLLYSPPSCYQLKLL
jgi:hypothetical protein